MKILVHGQLKERKNTDLDRNRIRYNWGYHDAYADFEEKRTRVDGLTVDDIQTYHFDPIYAKGYVAGWQCAIVGKYNGSSNDAWKESGIEDGYADHIIPPPKNNVKNLGKLA